MKVQHMPRILQCVVVWQSVGGLCATRFTDSDYWDDNESSHHLDIESKPKLHRLHPSPPSRSHGPALRGEFDFSEGRVTKETQKSQDQSHTSPRRSVESHGLAQLKVAAYENGRLTSHRLAPFNFFIFTACFILLCCAVSIIASTPSAADSNDPADASDLASQMHKGDLKRIESDVMQGSSHESAGKSEGGTGEKDGIMRRTSDGRLKKVIIDTESAEQQMASGRLEGSSHESARTKGEDGGSKRVLNSSESEYQAESSSTQESSRGSGISQYYESLKEGGASRIEKKSQRSSFQMDFNEGSSGSSGGKRGVRVAKKARSMDEDELESLSSGLDSWSSSMRSSMEVGRRISAPAEVEAPADVRKDWLDNFLQIQEALKSSKERVKASRGLTPVDPPTSQKPQLPKIPRGFTHIKSKAEQREYVPTPKSQAVARMPSFKEEVEDVPSGSEEEKDVSAGRLAKARVDATT